MTLAILTSKGPLLENQPSGSSLDLYVVFLDDHSWKRPPWSPTSWEGWPILINASSVQRTRALLIPEPSQDSRCVQSPGPQASGLIDSIFPSLLTPSKRAAPGQPQRLQDSKTGKGTRERKRSESSRPLKVIEEKTRGREGGGGGERGGGRAKEEGDRAPFRKTKKHYFSYFPFPRLMINCPSPQRS